MNNETHPGFEGGLILPFKGVWPKIGNDVFIAPTATIIGDVEIADEAVIMFGCTVRGDTNWIKIGKHSNLQDQVVIHVNAGKEPTSIGERVSVGHSVLLHACELQDGCLIGMRASVMDGAVIESGSLVAGGAVVVRSARSFHEAAKRAGKRVFGAGAGPILSFGFTIPKRGDRTSEHGGELRL